MGVTHEYVDFSSNVVKETIEKSVVFINDTSTTPVSSVPVSGFGGVIAGEITESSSLEMQNSGNGRTVSGIF